MKKLLYVFCLFILSFGIFSKPAYALTPLDNKLKNLETFLRLAEEKSLKTKNTVEAGRYAAQIVFLSNYFNGTVIQDKNEFNKLINSAAMLSVPVKVKLLDEKKMIDTKDVNKNLGRIDKYYNPMLYVVKHFVKTKTTVSIHYPFLKEEPIIETIVEQKKVEKTNKIIKNFNVNNIPDGYIFEGKTGLNNMNTLISQSKGDLINKFKILWKSNNGKYISITGYDQVMNSYRKDSVYMMGKTNIRFMLSLVKDGNSIEEVVFTEI